MNDAIPKHTYETTEGTDPTQHGQHQPRTMKHVVTVDHPELTGMMTEIGDGVFVAWTECRKCRLHVSYCPCPEGPVEPEYMQAWRDKRFTRTLNERPDPSYPMLDSVIGWVREHGYTVTKKGSKKKAEEPDSDDENEAEHKERILESDLLPGEERELAEYDAAIEQRDNPAERRDQFLAERGLTDDEGDTPIHEDIPVQIDEGLQRALEGVRAVKDAARLNGIDAGF